MASAAGSWAEVAVEPGWLTEDELASARDRVPILYVEAVPVRVGEDGSVEQVGLLLRALPDGTISRALVAGRVRHGERLRAALIRHIERDLGPLALPRLPVSPTPFAVVEYFPDPTVTGFHDPRQHAVSLAYVVPMAGECEPTSAALDLAWVTPEEASGDLAGELVGGQHRLLRMALAHMGHAGA
ncbi:MAG: DUF4916 domain-containing protein [Actinomycetales bacterium]|nr:DUF4916 domain-containing protein [Actinomycetales bacterium]